MIFIDNQMYAELAQQLVSELQNGDGFYNGKIEHDNRQFYSTLTCSLIVYHKNTVQQDQPLPEIENVVPVWWDFSICADGVAEVHDFSWSDFSTFFNGMLSESAENKIYTEAVKALRQKIGGFTLTESKKTYGYEHGRKKIKDEIVIHKEIGPDLASIQFVLTNLNPQKWSLKPEERSAGDSTTDDTTRKPDLSRLSDAALEELNQLCAP